MSSEYTEDPDNLHLLLGEVLRFPEVIFITLNYDTILDRRLETFDPIASLDDYVQPERRWKLVKCQEPSKNVG